MGRNKEPIALIVAKGKSHKSKEEINERLKQELQPVNTDIEAPAFLSKKQKAEFDDIVRQLKDLGIINETDSDAVTRYVLARELYLNLTKQLNSKEVLSDVDKTRSALANQHKAFNQVRSAAQDLGLTISSRAKLVVPKVKDDQPKGNKFAKFAT